MCGRDPTPGDLYRAVLVAEPIFDGGFGDAVDDLIVIELRIGKPIARLVDGDCGTGSAPIGEQD